jgi:undecaprenyl-phosphate galactose phosphotransferase/putative colanic acid biosynthesis UDP-glucose lipid carrier transferase
MHNQLKSKFIPVLLSAIDLLVLIISYYLAKLLVFDDTSPDLVFYSSLMIGWSVLWISLYLKFDLYEVPRIFYTHKILAKNVYVLFVFTFLSGGLIFFITDYKFSLLFFVYTISF